MAYDKIVDSGVLDGIFTAIANAIREKNETQNTYTPAQMASAITALPTGEGDLFSDIHLRQTQTAYNVPNDITVIPYYAFMYSPLASVILPSGLTEIGLHAFEHADITEITIPETVTKVQDYAFTNCGGLTRVVYEGQVPELRTYTFRYCTACLEYDFTHCTTVPKLASWSVFQDINANCKIIVPDALYDAWVAATNWTDSRIVGHITRESEA